MSFTYFNCLCLIQRTTTKVQCREYGSIASKYCLSRFFCIFAYKKKTKHICITFVMQFWTAMKVSLRYIYHVCPFHDTPERRASMLNSLPLHSLCDFRPNRWMVVGWIRAPTGYIYPCICLLPSTQFDSFQCTILHRLLPVKGRKVVELFLCRRIRCKKKLENGRQLQLYTRVFSPRKTRRSTREQMVNAIQAK